MSDDTAYLQVEFRVSDNGATRYERFELAGDLNQPWVGQYRDWYWLFKPEANATFLIVRAETHRVEIPSDAILKVHVQYERPKPKVHYTTAYDTAHVRVSPDVDIEHTQVLKKVV